MTVPLHVKGWYTETKEQSHITVPVYGTLLS